MDYFGYHLAPTVNELTPEQYLFILYGRSELEKEMNKVDKGKRKRFRR